MNLPNKLSTLRLILIPVFAAVFYLEFPSHYIVAAAVFAIAAFTDFLDGYIARKYSLVTDLGKFLDSSADKVLVLAALVLAVDAHLIPYFIGGVFTAVILAREIMVSCLRMIAAAKGVVMAADKLGKIKTFLQDIGLIVAILSGHFGNAVVTWVGVGILGASVVMTIVSGIHYFIVNGAVLSASAKPSVKANETTDCERHESEK